MKATSQAKAPIRYLILDCTHFSHFGQSTCVSKSGKLWSIEGWRRSRQEYAALVNDVLRDERDDREDAAGIIVAAAAAAGRGVMVDVGSSGLEAGVPNK